MQQKDERKKAGQVLVGFAAETQHVQQNAQAKLIKKNVDMIVANTLKVAGAGFGTDTNVVTLITRDAIEELPIMSKEDAAHAILNKIFCK